MFGFPRSSNMPKPPPPAQFTALRLLSHPRRFLLMSLLAEAAGPVPSADLGRRLRLKPSTLSGHLHELERAGLVELRPQADRTLLVAGRAEGVLGLAKLLATMGQRMAGRQPRRASTASAADGGLPPF